MFSDRALKKLRRPNKEPTEGVCDNGREVFTVSKVILKVIGRGAHLVLGTKTLNDMHGSKSLMINGDI